MEAETLVAFRAALAAPDFSHVTQGHPVDRDAFHVYRHDPASPTGCSHVMSISRDLPGAQEALAGHSTRIGGARHG